jgi:DNA cross-link repair 1A protein
MAAKSAPKASTPKPKSTKQSQMTQTTLIPREQAKRSPANNGLKGRLKATTNGNIMTFFQKAEELNNRLFMQERGTKGTLDVDCVVEDNVGWSDENSDAVLIKDKEDGLDERYNENDGSIKRRKLSAGVSVKACSPPLSDSSPKPLPASIDGLASDGQRKTGPFLDDSESEPEELMMPLQRRGLQTPRLSSVGSINSKPSEESAEPNRNVQVGLLDQVAPPPLKSEATSQVDDADFDGFEDLEDEELPEGEEYDERRWMEKQQRLEMAESGSEEDFEENDIPSLFPDVAKEDLPANGEGDSSTAACPICNSSLDGLDERESSVHVNACLDGKPIPIFKPEADKPPEPLPNNGSKMFKKPPRPAKDGQANPFILGDTGVQSTSAFSKLMSNHTEDAAWATAAASESAARGKPAYQRTCPFYKIMPGFYICVDAFRYGAVKGQNAYFLSHFHSDHYIGLTSTWAHGPIYCSKVTANLVRQQLRVDPKWVVDLDFEKKTEVPGTDGVHVTMIPANHCPGSSLFLFEKEMGKGSNPKLQRVLHCGDFRACRAHIEHPLLMPNVVDAVSGKNRQQKLDVCYLDTTYLNPKYAFPPQEQVIQACADMCVSLNKIRADETDGWEQMKRDRAGEGMVKFVRKGSDLSQEDDDTGEPYDAMMVTKPGSAKERGRLLVIVGTYSIGKERICTGIAKALGSKIYAAKGKMKICRALEDPELNALLTTNPREAQVHMTPLFEIRADTLEDYLRDFRDQFSRAVGFRPSGWNYRPPKGRFTENPAVQTVLHSQSWKSQFSMSDLTPQKGSTTRASCFGVPYSEHSSFRELTMFCCALRIDKIIPTVNIGNAKSRERMKAWCEKWAAEKKKNGLFDLSAEGGDW